MRALRPWILSILFLALVAAIVGSSATFQGCVQKEQQQAASQHFEKSATQFIAIYRPCMGEFVHQNSEATIAVFTIILAFATIFLWATTRDLVIGAEDTARRQLRAYVHHVSAIVRHVAVGERPIVRVEIKNLGQTPAYRACHSANYVLATYPWMETLEAPPVQSQFTMGAGSNAFLIVKASNEITDQQLAGLKSGELAIYIEGRITYADVFDHDHVTSYRLLVGGERGFPPDEALFTDIHGNDAD